MTTCAGNPEPPNTPREPLMKGIPHPSHPPRNLPLLPSSPRDVFLSWPEYRINSTSFWTRVIMISCCSREGLLLEIDDPVLPSKEQLKEVTVPAATHRGRWLTEVAQGLTRMGY